MTSRVLVVDDSGFFRRRLNEIIGSDPRLEVAGMATNGAEAVEAVGKLRPDVVTMDIEMPIMDGISAVRRIMSTSPTPIMMFSSLTHEGAQATLDALAAGALDFMPKRLGEIAGDQDKAKRELCERIHTLARRGLNARPRTAAAPPPPRAAVVPSRRRSHPYKLVAIGTSTGGPVALQQVLTRLPADFPLPILLIQHMPGSFTPAFAQRLDQACSIKVKEAAEGDELAPGTALLAPGGRQLMVQRRNGVARVTLRDSRPEEHYKPSVDIGFASADEAFPGEVLALVLTGMGADGREGARRLKAAGSTVWAQDEASCVVYGMPAAVVDAGIADRVVNLAEMGDSLAREA